MIGCVDHTSTKNVDEKPVCEITKMDLTYKQKIQLASGFYKNCKGTVVGISHIGTYNVDLNKECDNKKIYLACNTQVKILK